jgi:hypothetical protein
MRCSNHYDPFKPLVGPNVQGAPRLIVDRPEWVKLFSRKPLE